MLCAVGYELHDASASPDTLIAIGRLIERLNQRRLAAIEEFTDRFANLDAHAMERALDKMLKRITR
jgi:putative heme iron utilization protein